MSLMCLCSVKGRYNVSVCGQQMIIAVNWQELQCVCGLICDLQLHRQYCNVSPETNTAAR